MMRKCFNLNHLYEARGFTLLEVMIAVSILAIGFVAIFGSQSRSLSYISEAHFQTIASILSAGKIAEIQINGPHAVGYSGDFGDRHQGFTWSLDTEDALIESLSLLANLEQPLQKLTLSIKWVEAPYNYTLVYYGRWDE